MTTLKTTIQSLAQSFATDILEAIRGASLADLVGGDASSAPVTPSRTPSRQPTKRGRHKGQRSAGNRDATIARIVAELKTAKGGLRSEQLQRALGIDKATAFGALTKALEAKSIRKTGQKRSTTYFSR